MPSPWESCTCKPILLVELLTHFIGLWTEFECILWKILQERSERIENVRDEDIAKALLAACKGAAEPVLNAYDRLLSNAAVVPSPNLRIRLLRSVLVVLREWAMSVLSDRMGSSPTRSSLILGGSFALENKAALNQGARDKIANAANRQVCLCHFVSIWSAFLAHP